MVRGVSVLGVRGNGEGRGVVESEMEESEYGNTDTASAVSAHLTPEFPRKLLGNFADKYRNILQ